MEALAVSFIVGLGLLLGGAIWKGLARWVLGALGVAMLVVALSRICELYPNSCSINCWIGQLAGSPCTAVDLEPSPAPTSPSVEPSVTPSPTLPPTTQASPSVLPTTQASPSASASPSPSPSAPAVQPSLPPPAQTPSQRPGIPSASPCADGNCDCVDYKCLW